MARPITYLATHFPAVSHTFIADEIEALRRVGVDVVTISLNPVSDSDIAADGGQRHLSTTYLKTLPKLRVLATIAATTLRHPSVLTIPLRHRRGGLRAVLRRYLQLAEAIVVYRVMHKANSHHLHAHFGQAPASVAWYTTQVAHRHRAGRANTWSLTIHGWHEFAGERDAMLREKVAAADFTICVSDYTRAQLYRIASPADYAKIHVVRCGIDLTRFAPRTDEPSNSPPRVVTVARVSPEKGHLILVDAVAQLRTQGVPVIVDLVGPDTDGFGEVVRRHAEAVGVADAFVWHGPLSPDGVGATLAAADVFCLPTFAEGLPVVIMEAMARGVPVVTTYISGIPELAVDHNNALVVPAARADLLADAIASLLNDDALRQRLVAASLATVREQHDIERNITARSSLFSHAQSSDTRTARA